MARPLAFAGLFLLLAAPGCGNPEAPTAPRVASGSPSAPADTPAPAEGATKDAKGMQRVGGTDKP
jgi:hypothetical protein